MSSRSSSRSSRSSSKSSLSSGARSVSRENTKRSVSRSPGRSSSRSRSRSISSKSRSRSPGSRASSRSKSPMSAGSRRSSRSSSASSRSPSPEVAPKLKVKLKHKPGTATTKESSDEAGQVESDEDEEMVSPRKGRKGKKSPIKAKKKATSGRMSEEGEISDGSGNEFDDGLDENLIGDDEDRARLENMTERERELELFKRAETRENMKKRFQIQKKLKQQKLQGDKDVSDDDDFDYSQMLDAKERSHDRRKNLDAQKFDKKSTALSELKARKQERERKEQERKERREQEDKDKGDESSDDEHRTGRSKKRSRRDSSSSASSGGSYRRRSSSSPESARSSSSGGDSDTERFQKAPKIQKYVETQMDLEPIRLSRFKMEKFVHLPFFKRLVVGCFVRIGIGQHEGRSVYRCTEITDVCETAKVYHLGKTRTNIGLKLKFGKQERVFRLEFISNSQLTPSEFEKWKQTCLECNLGMPSKDFVQSKAEEIKKAMAYEYSSADVDAIIEKKERFSKFPRNYAMTKARLLKEKEIATADHNLEKAAEIEQQLQDLEHRAEELDRRRTENTQISSISLINNRNRKNNVEKAELAIQEEIKRKQNEGVENNPFTRRKCNPRMVTKTGKQDIDPSFLKQMAEMKEKQEKENRQKMEAQKRKQDESDHSEKAKKKLKAPVKEDLFDAHDFDIEIDVGATLDINGQTNVAPSTGMSSARPTTMAPRDSGPNKRSLNLSDYKKKRGLI